MKGKLLDDLLNSVSTETSDTNTPLEEDKILQPILEEVNSIKDHAIKQFVRSILLHSWTFFDSPAFFSGSTHPPDEASDGGNVLHTKRVFRTASLLCDSQQRTDFERDIVLAACILHDVTQATHDSNGILLHDPLHPLTIDRIVSLARIEDASHADDSSRSTSLYLDDEGVYQIIRLVHCSHGPWGPIAEVQPLASLEWIVHFADVIAANVHVIIDGDNIKQERWISG